MNKFLQKLCMFLSVPYALFIAGVENSHAQQSSAVWIDTDPACDHQKRQDVDDCWALLQALAVEPLDIRGISSVFGNGDEQQSFKTLNTLLGKFGRAGNTPETYRGAARPLDLDSPQATPASEAMARSLAKVASNSPDSDSLTIIALGPLTNVATLLLTHPEFEGNIKQVIAVAGQRSSQSPRFYPGQSRLFHVHDFNFRKDTDAFDTVLNSNIPVSLVPYEIGRQISIGATELLALANGNEQAQWLGEVSEPWFGFWRTAFRAKAFHPFDSLAVGYASSPELFSCESIPVKIVRRPALLSSSRDELLVSPNFDEERAVRYCYEVDPSFKSELLAQVSQVN